MAKGALLEKNSGAGGLLSNVEHITAAKTLEEKDQVKSLCVLQKVELMKLLYLQLL